MIDRTVLIKIIRSDKKEFVIDGTDWALPSKNGLDGFGTFENDITTVDNAVGDGGIITSDRIAQKDRTIVAVSRNNALNDVLRHKATAFFNSKFTYKIYITYMGYTRWCEGKIYKFKMPNGNIYRSMTMTVTFLCPDPYLKSYEDFGKNIASVLGMCGFPYMCYNGIRHVSKNLLKNTFTSKTVSGVTFTVNEDKSISANGTPTTSDIRECITDFIDKKSLLQNTIYILHGGLGVFYDIGMVFFKDGEELPIKISTGGESVRFSVNEILGDGFKIFISIKSEGITLHDKTFYPVIQYASTPSFQYEPYYDYPEYAEHIPAGTTGGLFNFANQVLLENDGDTETFCRAIFRANGAVTNPKLLVNDNYVRVIDVMAQGDIIEIDFTKNPPTVKKNGENYIGHCDRTSAFDDMALPVGDSVISFTADDGANQLGVSIYYNKLYGAM